MNFRAFEARAQELWEEIPDAYKEGVDGLVVSRHRVPHPELPEVYTLGECKTESYFSDYGSPDTTRSVVVLYHGSFRQLATLDPDFDWDEELWETLTHELQHHLESLAAEAGLEDFDYAADQHFKRLDGEPFEPFFYRSGIPLGAGTFRVDRDTYLEIGYPRAGQPTAAAEFEWQGARYRLPLPESLGDVCFIWLESGVPAEAGELHVVLVRKRGLVATLRGLLAPAPLDVVEAEGVAEPIIAPRP